MTNPSPWPFPREPIPPDRRRPPPSWPDPEPAPWVSCETHALMMAGDYLRGRCGQIWGA